MTIYLDACIAIYRVEQVMPWAAQVTAALTAQRGALLVVTDLVRMECRVGPLKTGDELLLKRFDDFFATASFLPLTTAVFDRAAELRAHHNLRTPDAIHLAAALTHRCDEFWTNDARLSGVSGDLRVRNFGAD